MDKSEMMALLNQVKNGEIDVASASEMLETTSDLGYANIDWSRKERTGYSEVIYSAGKTDEQILGIAQKMLERGEENILLTRASKSTYDRLAMQIPDLIYHGIPCSRSAAFVVETALLLQYSLYHYGKIKEKYI